MIDFKIWIPGITASVSGSLFAWFFVKKIIKKQSASFVTDTELQNLDEKRLHALANLKDLEQQKHFIDEWTYQESVAQLEKQAVELTIAVEKQQKLLLEKERTKQKNMNETTTNAAAESFGTRHPQLVGGLWGAGIVGVLVMLVFFLFKDQMPRGTGGSITGNAQTNGMNRNQNMRDQPPEHKEINENLQRLQENPKDLDALLRLGHILLKSQMVKEAAALNERALAIDPKNTEAQVHQALIEASEQPQVGMKKLDELVVEAPTFAEAWLFRGMLSMRSGDQTKMRESFSKFVQFAPDGPQKERIKAMLNTPAGVP